MNWRELFSSAITSLRSNILRTSLTMLGIIIGISSVILIYSIGQGAIKFVNNELSLFGTNFFQLNPGSGILDSLSGSATEITLDDVEAIKKDSSITNVERVGAFTMSYTVISANDLEKSVLIYGMSPEVGEMLKPIMRYGEFYTEKENLDAERVVVIGKRVGETFFGKDANPVGERIKIDNKSFRIVGVASSGSVLFGSFYDDAFFIPLNTAMNEVSGKHSIREVDIQVKDVRYMNDTINQVIALMRDRHNLKEGDENDFRVLSATDALSIVENITGTLTLIISAISAISLIVGGVGVMNIMLVSVTERTKEIGLLKAIGAREKDILVQFMIEAIVISLIGGAVGVLAGVGGALVVSVLFGIPFASSVFSILLALAVSTGVGLLFGIYPAKRAAALSPIEALKYE